MTVPIDAIGSSHPAESVDPDPELPFHIWICCGAQRLSVSTRPSGSSAAVIVNLQRDPDVKSPVGCDSRNNHCNFSPTVAGTTQRRISQML
jgi:hypothetical protein